jgi:hypothetical protein
MKSTTENIAFTYKCTKNYDESKPNNNFGDETTEIIIKGCYVFEDYLSTLGKIFDVYDDREDLYIIIDDAGNRTGEAFLIVSEYETGKPVTDDCNMGINEISRIIEAAYHMGRESAAREICDDAHKFFERQKKARAKESRESRVKERKYRNIAMQIHGSIRTMIVHDLYPVGDATNTFGKDYTNIDI